MPFSGDLMARPKALNAETTFRQNIAKYENWLGQGLLRLTNVPSEVRNYLESKRKQDRTFWFELLAQLDFYDAKILDYVYQAEQGATTLQLLVRRLRHIGIKREAIRRRVRMLANLGLLDLVDRTKPLCITSRIELEPNVASLIQGIYQRLGVGKE